mgnify:FL=1
MALQEPSRAFVGASWTALAVGTITYLLGLWNAQLALSEKGYYLVLLLFSIAIIWFVCSRFLAKSSARSTRTNTGNRNLFGHLLVWFDKFHRVVGSGFVECRHAGHGKRFLWDGLFAQPVCCGSGAKKCPRHFAISKRKWHRLSNSFRIVFTTAIRQR